MFVPEANKIKREEFRLGQFLHCFHFLVYAITPLVRSAASRAGE
jgi:hypothetical protein